MPEHVSAQQIRTIALSKEINLRYYENGDVGFSIDETTDVAAANVLLSIFAIAAGKDYQKVDDIPEKYGKVCNGVRLLVLGTVETGGGGCVCPEHVMLKRIINNLVLRREDVVILDMEAGLEHLGRGTTEGVDAFIVVIEPGARSVQTYKNVKRLAGDLGVAQVKVVANKVRNEEDEEFIRSRIPAEDLLGMLHYNTEVIDADRQGKSPYDFSQTVTAEITKIKEKIDQNSNL